MEVYNEVENDAGDAYPYDATAGAARQEQGEPYNNMQMVRHMEEEEDADRSELIDMGVFKPTSGNATKRLRMRQETRGITRATKTAEAALKQIASQELQAEKGKMQVWKQLIMKEVMHELQTVKESAEAQRVEVEVLRGQLQEMEEKSARLEKEIGLLKAKEQDSGQHLGKDTPAMGKNQAQPTSQGKSSENSASIIGKEIHPEHNPKTATLSVQPSLAKNTPKQNYTSVAAAKPAHAPEHPWTQVVYKNCKTNTHQSTKSNAKIENQGRRILFPREVSGQQMSEADIMLALNEALQKAGEGLDTRFCRVRYAPSGAISALLTENGNAGLLILKLSNLLIRAAKTVDPTVVGVEVLEHWQRLKVHGMSLERYLGMGKMELLKKEVESSTGIELKAHPRWLISEDRLREQQESGTKRGSAIVITVKGEAEAKKLCASGLRFGGLIKVVEKYWEAGPSLVCMTCCGIGHERMRDCGDRPARCVICAGTHKIEEHRCGVAGCRKRNGKICAHVTVVCANCDKNHTANSPQCVSRDKANVEARKEKKLKQSNKKEQEKIRSEVGEKKAKEKKAWSLI